MQNTKSNPFSQQTRQDITRSIVNRSTAKHLWSFSKQKRFSQFKAACPYIGYLKNTSTFNKRNTNFGYGDRKVFQPKIGVPTSWQYNPKQPESKSFSTFAKGRQECIANSYIPLETLKNPGPGRYQRKESQKHGYSLRPKTAYQRTYFIQNKQLMQRPSPQKYDTTTARQGYSTISKFKTVIFGPCLQTKQNRFKNPPNTSPGPTAYQPKKNSINKYSKGGQIGHDKRKCFVDQTSNQKQYLPGPGNYKIPSQFGHYRRLNTTYS